ncbi:MAG: GNAT family N-acetyltransferase [Actinomycetota bacterium]
MQRTSALVGFKHIFPPAEFPFPDDAERSTWDRLLRSLEGTVLVTEVDGRPVAVAVVGKEELLRFYVMPERWGTGVADHLHEEVIALVRSRGDAICRLWVLEENGRARRFYERRGWLLDGRTRVARFPPYPAAVGYTLRIASFQV